MRYKSKIILEPDQEKFIKENCKTMYVRDMAKELGMSYTRIYEYIQQNNLPQRKQTGRREVKVIEGYFNVHQLENWVA